jgi:hypothetical protein
MSAFGGKADMTLCGNSLLWSLLGVKRICLFAAQMSAMALSETAINVRFIVYKVTLTTTDMIKFSN